MLAGGEAVCLTWMASPLPGRPLSGAQKSISDFGTNSAAIVTVNSGILEATAAALPIN